jgi:hypothetical protein
MAKKNINTNYLTVGKASDDGIRINPDNPDFGWRDIIGLVLPDPAGTNSPTLKAIVGSVRGYAYANGDKLDCVYHLPHDYVLGTDLYIHLHWLHNGTNISGTFDVDVAAMYADRDGTFETAIATAVTESVNITSHPQYFHRVLEIQLSTPGGSASLLDTDSIEVDGNIVITFTVDNGALTVTGGDMFILTGDIHYQSNNLSTKNKDPDFYT